ncbi:TRAP transporter small permease [Thermodesulfobacteriota bacterium]
MKIINLIDHLLELLEKWLVIFSFSLMLFFSFINVILRTLYIRFDLDWANSIMSRIDWSEPFARLMVLWVAFLGASLLTKDNRHIRIDIMGHLLSPIMNMIRELVLSAGCITICLIMISASIGYIKVEMQYSTGSFLIIPLWVYQLVIPFGFSTMCFRFFINGIKQALSITGEIKS